MGPLVDLLEDIAPNSQICHEMIQLLTSEPVASLDFVIFHSRKMLIT
jgi:hypothetical protein